MLLLAEGAKRKLTVSHQIHVFVVLNAKGDILNGQAALFHTPKVYSYHGL